MANEKLSLNKACSIVARIFSYLHILGFCLLAVGLAEAQDLPNNAHKTPYGPGWTCDRGFYRHGNNCLPVKVPIHGKLNYLGHGWECERGFYQYGKECLPVKIPTHGKLNYLGHGWECERGYYQHGNKCLPVKVPKHGKLTYFGHGWECEKRFKKVGNNCVKMTSKEVAKQLAIEKKIREKILHRKAKGVSGEDCDTEYKTNAQVCINVTNVSLNCNKSYAGEYYNDCDVSVSYNLETDYRGGAYLDVNINCSVEINYSGKEMLLTQSDSDNSSENHSLYAHDSSGNSMDFNFSFSSFYEVTRVKVNSCSCKIESVDLY